MAGSRAKCIDAFDILQYIIMSCVYYNRILCFTFDPRPASASTSW